jgi:hypothetical protein
MPMRLDPGWNQITFDLADYTKRAYGTQYVETLRVTVHANCRLRRIYFTDKLYSENELPPEFKLFLPVSFQSAYPHILWTKFLELCSNALTMGLDSKHVIYVISNLIYRIGIMYLYLNHTQCTIH